ncbi:hypothetical protein AWB76_06809 [Caballeronia temeraria]|uniref:Uncharacterized protein n=1 Tax=Caballeronia temeraria TaxID=1777137 RepID=A0A158DDN5_9BURK|nr:hypothetical protein [Caballeronia temeraria]SAK92386.1 hypothetical protein AWB76_06809 [Caballeronia temeraria]
MDFQPTFAVFFALGSSVFAACIVPAFFLEMIDARVLKRQARPATKRIRSEPSPASMDEKGPHLHL